MNYKKELKRLDKILCESGEGSRTECDALIKRGHVSVDGVIVKRPDSKFSTDCNIEIDGNSVSLHRTVVCMMNKGPGYVTSTEDPRDPTVMLWLPDEFKKQNVVPVGRLDKDTEGLLLFTNDGNLLHKLISPKYAVPKLYYVEHENDATEEIVSRAADGVVLKDGTVCKSAVITRLEEGKSTIQITEGMYHQVKRMYSSLGLHIKFLKRMEIGGIKLGNLEQNKVRELTEEEYKTLLNLTN